MRKQCGGLAQAKSQDHLNPVHRHEQLSGLPIVPIPTAPLSVLSKNRRKFLKVVRVVDCSGLIKRDQYSQQFVF